MFFESPNRLAASLKSASDVLGAERPAAVCRELTKAYEEIRRGKLGELAAQYADENVRGEIVLAIGPGSTPLPSEDDIDALLTKLAAELPAGKAATEAARLTGVPRKELYQRLLAHERPLTERRGVSADNRLDRKRRSERKGRRAEWFAALALMLKGYRIVSLRYKTPVGEIDLVARKRDLIAFVEVKARKDLASGVDAVSYPAQRRIAAAGELFIS